MEKIKKSTKITLVIIFACLIIILFFIGKFAYSKYVEKNEGNATASVAEMICTMDVVSSSEDDNENVINPADKSIINPYCIVTVKNYRGSNQAIPVKTTETDVSYTISVKPKVDSELNSFVMPEYNWYEISGPNATNGTIVATSTDLTSSVSKGDFKSNVPETRYYKIVFLNSGEKDITRYVDFDIKAVQVKPE